MNNRLNRCIICIVFLLVIILGGFKEGWAAKKIILIQGWEPWSPFTYVDNRNKLTGLDIEIIHQIFSRAGYEVKYRAAPWARQLKDLEEGMIQITASSMKTPEREVYAYFSDPYYRESYIVFVRKGEAANYHLKHLRDIIGSSFRLGVMRDSLYGDDFVRLMKEPAFSKQIEAVTMDDQNHKKLLAHRVDGFVQESSRMSTEGRKTGIFSKVEPLLVIEENYLHFMFSKKSTNPEIVKVFNIGLKNMRKDGNYQRIFKKYRLDQYNMLKD